MNRIFSFVSVAWFFFNLHLMIFIIGATTAIVFIFTLDGDIFHLVRIIIVVVTWLSWSRQIKNEISHH